MTSSPKIQWHRSSYSNGMGGECLEVAALAEEVAVRDSKITLGPQITLGNSAWRGFIQALPSPIQSRAVS
ncbi:DUF397 domain-containing protein [Streptomyces sp. NPDC048179]|uniref:DUF397 domain-containing protein n=1 Tax=Streptomyces sp. NPDC048179 TaxID=3365506 RepID=UPI00371AA99E